MTAEVRPETANAEDPAGGRSAPISPPPLDRRHEARLRAWAEGWDACRAWMQPQLDRAQSDADRNYRAAFRTPAARREHMDEAAEAHWQAFMAGGPL